MKVFLRLLAIKYIKFSLQGVPLPVKRHVLQSSDVCSLRISTHGILEFQPNLPVAKRKRSEGLGQSYKSKTRDIERPHSQDQETRIRNVQHGRRNQYQTTPVDTKLAGARLEAYVESKAAIHTFTLGAEGDRTGHLARLPVEVIEMVATRESDNLSLNNIYIGGKISIAVVYSDKEHKARVNTLMARNDYQGVLIRNR